jgi:hypothetical protein
VIEPERAVIEEDKTAIFTCPIVKVILEWDFDYPKRI